MSEERVKRETSKKPKLQIMRITWRSRTIEWEREGELEVNEGMFVAGRRCTLLSHTPSLSLSLALCFALSRNQPLPSAIPVECFDLQANHKNKCIKSNGKSMEPTINCVDGIARGLYKLFYCSNNTKEFGFSALPFTAHYASPARHPLPRQLG